MIVTYIIWIVLAVVSFFMLPEFFPGLNLISRTAYSLFLSFGISMIYALFHYISKLNITTHESDVELPQLSISADGDFYDFTGMSIPANRIVNRETVRGELSFSAKGLTFSPKAYSIQNETASWKYSNIKALDDGIMGNIKITTSDGESEIFVVKRQKEILEYLKRQVHATKK